MRGSQEPRRSEAAPSSRSPRLEAAGRNKSGNESAMGVLDALAPQRTLGASELPRSFIQCNNLAITESALKDRFGAFDRVLMRICAEAQEPRTAPGLATMPWMARAPSR